MTYRWSERLQIVAQYLDRPFVISQMPGLGQILVTRHCRQKGFHIYQKWKTPDLAGATLIEKTFLFLVLKKMAGQIQDIRYSHKREYLPQMVIGYVRMDCANPSSIWNEGLHRETWVLIWASGF